MHLGAQLFEPFLMGHAEMLLLVDDEQAKVAEFDRLAEQRMRTDDDVDAAVGNSFLHPRQLRGGDQSRGLRDVNGKSAKPLGEGVRMLAGKECRRHHQRDLSAVHGGDEGCPQRHLGLAEPHVAADQPVHRPSGREFVQYHVDYGLLVLGLFIGKSRAELVVGSGFHGQTRRLPQLPFGRDLDQAVGDVADATLHARFARLPRAATEPIELDPGLFRAIAGQKLDVLDRQEQLVAAGVMDFQAIVRRARGFDRAQPDEASDAMIDVDHEIPGGKARHFRDEVFRPA